MCFSKNSPIYYQTLFFRTSPLALDGFNKLKIIFDHFFDTNLFEYYENMTVQIVIWSLTFSWKRGLVVLSFINKISIVKLDISASWLFPTVRRDTVRKKAKKRWDRGWSVYDNSIRTVKHHSINREKDSINLRRIICVMEKHLSITEEH